MADGLVAGRQTHSINSAGIGAGLPTRPAVANVSCSGTPMPMPMPMYWGRSIGLGLFSLAIMASAQVSAAQEDRFLLATAPTKATVDKSNLRRAVVVDTITPCESRSMRLSARRP